MVLDRIEIRNSDSPIASDIELIYFESTHVEELNYATAMPELVFKNIFSNLSPAYLWHFCRPVCKSWKDLIDKHMFHFLNQKAFIQLIMTKQLTESDIPIDLNYIEFSTIYRAVEERKCEYQDFHGGFPYKTTIIFKPLNEGRPFTCEYLPRHQFQTTNYDFADLSIHSSISSLFPRSKAVDACRRPGERKEYLLCRRDRRENTLYKTVRGEEIPTRLAGAFGASKVYMEECEDPRQRMSIRQIQEYNNRPPLSEGHVLSWKSWEHRYADEATMSNLQFGCPEVFVRLRCAPADGEILCRFLTKRFPILEDHPAFLPDDGPSWEQKCTLIIDSMEIDLVDLLKWDCGHCPRCPMKNLLSRRVTTIDANGIPKISYVPGCSNLRPYEDPMYQRMFPRYPCSDREHWLSGISRFGSAVSSFAPDVAVRRIPLDHKLLTRPTRKCPGCEERVKKEKAEYDMGKDEGVLWASGRCEGGLCAKCCQDVKCKGHKKCVHCRWNLTSNSWTRFLERKDCLKIFDGEPCFVKKKR